jgi:predicted Zn-dependent protease with MMP-like domain
MRDRRGQDEFDRALRKALSELPPMFRDALANVAVVVEEWPPDELLDELGVPPDDTLYGFYHGPLMEDFPDRRELCRQIRITLLHEIGHYFGMDEEELSRLGYE